MILMNPRSICVISNEISAGENGRVTVKEGRFTLGSGQATRFSGVNGPPDSLRGEELKRCARTLARRGVNLIRIHGGAFDHKTGAFNVNFLDHYREIISAMKDEGIYSHLSIYFPLWFTPKPELETAAGYDGNSHPFGTLFFNQELQKQYLGWWTSILTTKDANGRSLNDEPALMSVELVNEDSLFFWTFNDANLPEPQKEILKKKFFEWALIKYGSSENIDRAWEGSKLPSDVNQRLGFRTLLQILSERTPRDQAGTIGNLVGNDLT